MENHQPDPSQNPSKESYDLVRHELLVPLQDFMVLETEKYLPYKSACKGLFSSEKITLVKDHLKKRLLEAFV